MVISFEELRNVKHSLPHGSVSRIAKELNISEQSVRNYFGAQDFDKGDVQGLHIQPGPHGGIVVLEDTRIFDLAKRILSETETIQSSN